MKISAKERDTIVQALSAGVVPRLGLARIQVGRAAELSAMVRDLDRVVQGGSAVRFVIGEYGSGKTFFANLVRLIALEKKCVTIHADLGPDRRIHGTGGQARALYSEAVRNMSTRTKPDGNGLAAIVERFVTEASRESDESKVSVEKIIDQKLAAIQDLVGGYDFAHVIKAYWRGSEDSNEALKISAIRWLRGEFSTKTEARQSLGVRTIVDDENIYDAIKILAAFVSLAGYGGLVVVLDEMVNIYKLQNSQARKQNYEQLLRVVNDTLQGTTSRLGFVFCGTPEFQLDTRRGLNSYEALQSRLAENKFATGGLVDLSGPIIRLQSLTPEDLLVLLTNVRSVFALGNASKHLVPDQALRAFMEHCNKRIGEAYFRTPRNTIKAFVQFLSVLEQNSDARWQSLISDIPLVPDVEDQPHDPGSATEVADDELTNLRIGS